MAFLRGFGVSRVEFDTFFCSEMEKLGWTFRPTEGDGLFHLPPTKLEDCSPPDGFDFEYEDYTLRDSRAVDTELIIFNL